MNLIPTQEQVSEWIRTTQLEPHGEGWSREQRIAELAAQWGAEQATPTSTVDFLPHDDYLRFAQRVLEGDAPTESDRKEAARMICDIRRALYIQRGKQTKVEGS